MAVPATAAVATGTRPATVGYSHWSPPIRRHGSRWRLQVSRTRPPTGPTDKPTSLTSVGERIPAPPGLAGPPPLSRLNQSQWIESQ